MSNLIKGKLRTNISAEIIEYITPSVVVPALGSGVVTANTGIPYSEIDKVLGVWAEISPAASSRSNVGYINVGLYQDSDGSIAVSFSSSTSGGAIPNIYARIKFLA